VIQTPSLVFGDSTCDDIASDVVQSILYDLEPDKTVLLRELSSVKGELEIVKLELDSYRQREREGAFDNPHMQNPGSQPQTGRQGGTSVNAHPSTTSNPIPVRSTEQGQPPKLPQPAQKFPSQDAALLLKAEQCDSRQQGNATGSSATPHEANKAKLEAAYEQIAQLNTQMAHLYTELTFARTGSYRQDHPNAQKYKFEADLCKRSEQIGILVQDIRHLQADLEFHQQLLDEQKMEENKRKEELEQAIKQNTALREKLVELEGQLKHQEIDKTYYKSLKTDEKGAEAIHFVSYDLQRERTLREKLEEKNARLNERYQKSMLILESQRHKIHLLERQIQKLQRTQRRDVQSRNRGMGNLPRLPHTSRESRENA